MRTPLVPPKQPRIKVDIWSDVACPWCYIGKRRFETALTKFPERDLVDVTWRSFELDTTAAPTTAEHPREHLAAKYGETQAGAQRMIDQMTQVAETEGLDFNFDRLRRANTFLAHQLVHLAAQHGLQDGLKERLLRAHFSEGEDLGKVDVLVKLGGEVGLDEDAAHTALEAGTYAQAVRDDEAQAQAYGIGGVPFFVLNDTYGVSGAQSAEVFLGALTQVLQQRPLQLLGREDAPDIAKTGAKTGAETGVTEGCEDGACAVPER